MGANVDEVWKHVRIETSNEDDFTRALVRGKHEILMDESPELPYGGSDEGPSAVDLLVTSLLACQVSVLQQCFEKARIEEYEIEAEATIDDRGEGDIPGEMPENTAGRVEHVVIDLDATVPEELEPRARRCLDVYDDGCIVGQSLLAGIDYSTEARLTISGAAESDD